MTIFASPVLGHDGRPFDQIRLAGVTATGYHGVLEHERTDGQVFRADVVLHLDTRPAASGDSLAQTVSYAEVAQDVHDVLTGSPADLIETVAERIAAAALEYPGVVAVDVRVHKPSAPIPVPFDDVEVAIRRDHEKAPVVAAAPAEPAPAAEPVAVPVPAPVPLPVPVAVVAPVEAPVAEAVEAEPHAVDRLEVDPPDPVEVVLGIGGNLGDVQATLRAAVTDLDRLPGIQVVEVSPLARTTAVGGPADQPDYLNAVLIARTTLSPRGLLRATQAVENAHGRVREERWGPRTLDVDIVRYGSLVVRDDDLELPHPRAHERAFVLVPWAEVQPDAELPGLGGGPVSLLAATAPDRAGIRWLALDWLAEPGPRTGSEPAVNPPAESTTPAGASSPDEHADAAPPAFEPHGFDPAPQHHEAAPHPYEPAPHQPAPAPHPQEPTQHAFEAAPPTFAPAQHVEHPHVEHPHVPTAAAPVVPPAQPAPPYVAPAQPAQDDPFDFMAPADVPPQPVPAPVPAYEPLAPWAQEPAPAPEHADPFAPPAVPAPPAGYPHAPVPHAPVPAAPDSHWPFGAPAAPQSAPAPYEPVAYEPVPYEPAPYEPAPYEPVAYEHPAPPTVPPAPAVPPVPPVQGEAPEQGPDAERWIPYDHDAGR